MFKILTLFLWCRVSLNVSAVREWGQGVSNFQLSSLYATIDYVLYSHSSHLCDSLPVTCFPANFNLQRCKHDVNSFLLISHPLFSLLSKVIVCKSFPTSNNVRLAGFALFLGMNSIKHVSETKKKINESHYL